MKPLKNLEKSYEQLIDKYKAPGVIIALSEKDKKVYQSAKGYRDIEASLPITDDTVLGLASVTKSFTCCAIMHLQENQKLSVYDKVIDYLPEFRLHHENRIDQISIHHFMTHSSGFPPLFALEYAIKRLNTDDPPVYTHVGENQEQPILHTYEDLMDYIAERKIQLYADPGKQFSYSNEAYSLLGAIIERVSGQSYESYVYDHIVKPAGMDHTRFTMKELDDYENKTISYGKTDENGEETIITDPIWSTSTSMQATGFLKSTANDMLKYAQIYLNKGRVNGKEILSEQSVQEMINPQMKVHRGQYYGYGLRIIPDYFGHTFIGHGGSLRSVSARFGIIPEKGLAGIVLANLIGFPASRLLDYVFNDYLGKDIATSIDYEAYDIPSENLDIYAGEYKSDEGAHITLKKEDRKLKLINKGIEYSTMFISQTEFFALLDGSKEFVEILLDENKSPYALLYSSRVVHKVSANSVY